MQKQKILMSNENANEINSLIKIDSQIRLENESQINATCRDGIK